MPKKRLAAFSWYGGKNAHLGWLLPIIDGTPHKSFVESFGGSAAVLLNKKPSPVEVYNDLNGNVVNFFRILRNRKDELIPLLLLTPYAREELANCCSPSPDNLEQARRFFVCARQIRDGLATKASVGRWSYTKKDARRGWSLPVSQWFSAIDGLDAIALRLAEVQIEHLDGLDVISRYDTPETLHYIDPPYLMSSRTGGENYSHEFDEKQHISLLSLLKKVLGKVVLSGYASELYSDLLRGWNTYFREEKLANTTLCDGKKEPRQEVLWANFDCKPFLRGGWETTD